MKITNTYLTIPPYLSAQWSSILSVHKLNGEDNLTVTLTSGKEILIPNLSEKEIKEIYRAHGEYFENNKSDPLFNQTFPELTEGLEFPAKFGIGAVDQFGTSLQHNPENANLPNMPKEVLDRISSIAKIMIPEDGVEIPSPEPHCNCMHCQVARAIEEGMGTITPHNNQLFEEESTTTEGRIPYEKWIISDQDDKLYHVINKENPDESYRVHLGNPVGCTCGKEGCEHVIAVLKS